MTIASTAQARETLLDGVRAAIRSELAPPERMTVVEWAEDFRKLSKKSSAREGKFRTSDIEVARGPMHAPTEPGVNTITLMICRQTLKTTLIENVIGRFAHIDPCPILVVYPKDDAAEGFSKERLTPMIEATAELRERFSRGRSDDTVHYKAFPGGFVSIVSAGSPMNLAMRPVRITLCDEIDKFEPNKEGDPITQAEECSSSWRSRKLNIRACSPTWEETSRIFRSYQESDQRRAFASCPHCDHWQDLDFFRHVQWEKIGGKHQPKTAAIFCEKCGVEWSEGDRARAIGKDRVRWFQCATFVCCGEGQDPRMTRLWHWDDANQVGYALCRRCGARAVSNNHAGFTCSKLFNRSYTIVQLAEMWVEASKSEDTKQTFVNQQLGLPYKAQVTRAIAASSLAERAEDFPLTVSRRPIVPTWVCVITVGADVQPGSQAREGRIELETVGWGIGEESISLGFEVFTGDPSQLAVWAEVDKYLTEPWHREDGHVMAIRATCVDSGGLNTEDVYKFCRARIARNVWAIKGASDRGGQWSPVWPQVIRQKRARKYRTGQRPIVIGVNAAKEAVRQRLLITEPGAGYCHFPVGRPAAYFEQLTSENLVITGRGGARVRKWVLPKDRANEALDCRVYAYAALCGLYVVRRFDMVKTAQIIAGAPAPPGTPPAEVIATRQRQQSQQSERQQQQPAAVPVPQPRVVPMARPHRQVRRGIWRTR